jgi:hypothetical protein
MDLKRGQGSSWTKESTDTASRGPTFRIEVTGINWLGSVHSRCQECITNSGIPADTHIKNQALSEVLRSTQPETSPWILQWQYLHHSAWLRFHISTQCSFMPLWSLLLMVRRLSRSKNLEAPCLNMLLLYNSGWGEFLLVSKKVQTGYDVHSHSYSVGNERFLPEEKRLRREAGHSTPYNAGCNSTPHHSFRPRTEPNPEGVVNREATNCPGAEGWGELIVSENYCHFCTNSLSRLCDMKHYYCYLVS